MKKSILILAAVMVLGSVTAKAQSQSEIADAKKQLKDILAGKKLTEQYL